MYWHLDVVGSESFGSDANSYWIFFLNLKRKEIEVFSNHVRGFIYIVATVECMIWLGYALETPDYVGLLSELPNIQRISVT